MIPYGYQFPVWTNTAQPSFTASYDAANPAFGYPLPGVVPNVWNTLNTQGKMPPRSYGLGDENDCTPAEVYIPASGDVPGYCHIIQPGEATAVVVQATAQTPISSQFGPSVPLTPPPVPGTTTVVSPNVMVTTPTASDMATSSTWRWVALGGAGVVALGALFFLGSH